MERVSEMQASLRIASELWSFWDADEECKIRMEICEMQRAGRGWVNAGLAGLDPTRHPIRRLTPRGSFQRGRLNQKAKTAPSAIMMRVSGVKSCR